MTPVDPEFDEYSTYKNQVYGFIRSRTDQDADAEEVAQETWIVLWQIYDPARGSFLPFARLWAGIMLLRHYHAQGRRRKVEELFADLLQWFPDLEREEEIADILAAITEQPAGGAAEDTLWLAEAYDTLLRLACSGPNPPHQLIAFLLCKFLDWAPREIVRQCKAIPLSDLVEQLATELIQRLPLAEDSIHRHLEPLRHCLERQVQEVIVEERTRQTHSILLEWKVGETTLADYFTKSDAPEANISNWWYSVRRRLVKAIQQQGTGLFMTVVQE